MDFVIMSLDQEENTPHFSNFHTTPGDEAKAGVPLFHLPHYDIVRTLILDGSTEQQPLYKAEFSGTRGSFTKTSPITSCHHDPLSYHGRYNISKDLLCPCRDVLRLLEALGPYTNVSPVYDP
ncbi:hypothetical protein TNCV_4383851 [Trichonephila clavipes]|nr:hypothetical protein TNCV_4383851 [Trichonephila clavipes]